MIILVIKPVRRTESKNKICCCGVKLSVIGFQSSLYQILLSLPVKSYFTENILQDTEIRGLRGLLTTQRVIQNPYKHLRWSIFKKYLKAFSR